MPRKTVRIKSSAAKRIASAGLWIYSNEVLDDLTSFENGELVDVRGPAGSSLGIAGVEPHSLIALRLLAGSGEEPPDGPRYFLSRIEAAERARRRFIADPCYRVVFSEADLLPGLVVDRYGGLLVVQLLTWTMERLKGRVVEALQALYAPEGIVVRNDLDLRREQGLPLADERLLRDETLDLRRYRVSLLGFRLFVDLDAPQKTGLFLDQVGSYRAVDAIDFGAMSGADLFCYSGLFGMIALRRGAERVTFVDASQASLDLLEENLEANGVEASRRVIVRSDVLAFLPLQPREANDFLFVDPPKFIPSRKHFYRGLQGYFRLNRSAVETLADGGLLFTFSCSHHAGEELFAGKVRDAIESGGASGYELARFHQYLDHPVHIAMPESAYLKGLLFRIERRRALRLRDERPSP